MDRCGGFEQPAPRVGTPRDANANLTQVYAARKEDTMGLFALKLMPLVHASSARGRHHLLVERRILERAAMQGSSSLCSLRYAFVAGPWLALALPFLTGGTLQLHIDERAPFGMLDLRWAAAQITLALEAVHSLSMIHRDIKPSNIIMDRDGYLLLSDFGLAGKLGSTSRSGTRGYWSPETTQRMPQYEAADWWSLGITLWHASCAKHPMHRIVIPNLSQLFHQCGPCGPQRRRPGLGMSVWGSLSGDLWGSLSG